MATRFIERNAAPTAVPGDTAGNVAPIGVDSDSEELKFYDRTAAADRTVVTLDQTQTLTGKTLTAPTITAPVISGVATIATGAILTNPSIAGITPVAFAAGTVLALTEALHANRVVWVTDVAAAYTLPLATGTGNKYTIILGATITGASTIKVADAADTFVGMAILSQDGGDTLVMFEAAATDDTVDLLGTANSTGGLIGSIYEFWDVASGKWAVRIIANAGGTEATPFSATV